MMRKMGLFLAALMLVFATQANAWWGNNNRWDDGWNDWPEWTPMYWMEEMENEWDDDDYYGYGPYGGYPGYGYGGYPPPYRRW